MLDNSMVRNSYPMLKPETYNKISDIFFEVFIKNKNQRGIHDIFLDLFTPAERIMFFKRVTITYLLLKNIDYTVICKTLRVSNTTVSKLKLLSENSHGLVPALKKIIKQKDFETFFEKLFIELFPPGTYGTDWKSAWNRKIQLNKKLSIGL